MSASTNSAAAAGQGEFRSKVAATAPEQTTGHQPGRIVSEKDAAPEFHAQTLAAGTAPESKTFKPNNLEEVPGQDGARLTSASDTLGGTDSGAVHTGVGKPLQGQTSNELRHDGKHHRKAERSGLEGVGASGVPSAKAVDAHDPKFADQRGLGKEEVKGAGKGLLGGEGAGEAANETADGGRSAGYGRVH